MDLPWVLMNPLYFKIVKYNIIVKYIVKYNINCILPNPQIAIVGRIASPATNIENLA